MVPIGFPESESDKKIGLRFVFLGILLRLLAIRTPQPWFFIILRHLFLAWLFGLDQFMRNCNDK